MTEGYDELGILVVVSPVINILYSTNLASPAFEAKAKAPTNLQFSELRKAPLDLRASHLGTHQIAIAPPATGTRADLGKFVNFFDGT